MYKHLLVPTDGSELSMKALAHAIEIARSVGARITALWAAPDVSVEFYGDGAVPDAMLRPRHVEEMDKRAAKIFEPMRAEANAAKVRFDDVHVLAEHPWVAIIDAAETHGCDVIVMASHGHGGFAALLLGSETQKVLTHVSLPVIIVR